MMTPEEKRKQLMDMASRIAAGVYEKNVDELMKHKSSRLAVIQYIVVEAIAIAEEIMHQVEVQYPDEKGEVK